jgi:hypothetical protein
MDELRNWTIDVGLDDIERGKLRNSSNCPIAYAVRRATRGTHISVDTSSIRFTLDGVRYVYFVPPIAQRFIINFDLGEDAAEVIRFVLHEGVSRTVRHQVVSHGRPKGSVSDPTRQRRNRRTYGARAMTGPEKETK